jgi:hypothetical protein
MPLDKYLPPENLKVEQIIARNYGHVRTESGVSKYYWPDVKAVFSWTTPEIFNDQEDFYSASVACQSNFVSSATGTSYYVTQLAQIGTVSIGTYYNQPGILGRQNKRVVIDADINGDPINGDGFTVTAGFTKYLGIAVKTKYSTYYNSFSDPQIGFYRQDSAIVSVGIALNTAFVLPGRSTPTSSIINGMFDPQPAASFATISTANNPVALGFTGGAPSTLTFSVATLSAGSFVVTVPFRSTAQSGNAPGVLIPWSQSSGPDELVNEIYRVSVISAGETVVSGFLTVSNIVTVSSGGFQAAFSGVPTTGSYTVRVEEKRPAIYSVITGGANQSDYNLITAAVCCQGVSTVSVSSTMTLSGLDTAVVTGEGAITGGGTASVSTVPIATAVSSLATDWAIQDLQINLRTRAVQSSLTTIKIKPNDTAILGVLFHDGTNVIDPGATTMRLAARPANNAAAYSLYNINSTIVSVSNANYYRVEILANDPDLLDNQNTNLLAGSNSAQSLLGEIQWTTTRGTFSSDTFTINVPSEVVREPDV